MRPEAVLVASPDGVLTSTGGLTCSLRGRVAVTAEPEPEPEPVLLAGGGALADALSALDLVHARHPNDKNKIVIPRISARTYGTGCEFASRRPAMPARTPRASGCGCRAPPRR